MTASHPRVVCLFLNWPWPANSGARIRAAAIVEALRVDHDVTVLASDHAASGYPTWDAGVRRVAARRERYPARARDIIEGAALGDHTAARRAIHAGLPEAFAELLAAVRPVVVVLGRPFFGRFTSEARAAGARVVIDADERLRPLGRAVMVAPRMPLSARLRAALEMTSLDRMERREYPRADRVWVASDRERTDFADIVPQYKLECVPNPIPADVAPFAGSEVRAVAYVGSYGHAPNEAAVLELIGDVMPAVRASGGPDRLVIIGREPTPRMRQAAASIGNVEITGEVADARAMLASAGLLVLPIRAGGGTRVKALEAGALGVPIISTRLGVDGLDLEPGVHYLAAETAAEFAAAVAAVREDGVLRNRLVSAAREHILARHGPPAILAAVRAGLPAIP